MKKCPKCKYPNPDDRIFCFQCNADLRPTAPPPPAAPPPPPAPPPVVTQAAPSKAPQSTAAKAVTAVTAVVLLLIILVVLTAFPAMMRDVNADRNLNYLPPTKDTTSLVTYEVTGTASSASMTYETPGGTSQQSDMSLPWSHTFSAEEGQFLYISAQNQDRAGTVTAAIKVDGVIAKSSTSSGAYVIASTSGRL